MSALLGFLGTVLFFFLFMSLITAGPRVMIRWPLILFRRKPKYVIVKNKGGYFPIKRDPFAYRTMYRDKFNEPAFWEKKTNVQSVHLKYPDLYGANSMERAKSIIEQLEGEEIKEVSGNGYGGIFWRGNATFFERKSYEPMNIGIAPFKSEEQEPQIDAMIDAKFSDEEIMETEVGAERDLFRDRRTINNG